MIQKLEALWILSQTEKVEGDLSSLTPSLGIKKSYEFLLGYSSKKFLENSDFKNVKKVFFDSPLFESDSEIEKSFGGSQVWAVKFLKPGVQDPQIVSLETLLGKIHESQFSRLQILELESTPKDQNLLRDLRSLWCEPAIETLELFSGKTFLEYFKVPKQPNRPEDNSAKTGFLPQELGLEFSSEELQAIHDYEKKRKSPLTRTEWEVLAQSWSEHCKHKIFGAKITGPDLNQGEVDGLFKQFIRNPSLAQIEKDKKENRERALSVFVDNAGVLKLFDTDGEPTPWAYCLKMETHNSPSALSPRGGAATGLVGVHRDILGAGRLARPIANWDVLCFESPEHKEPRPATALSPKIIRSGVLRGIEEGGNQSGIPTVMGSVVFDPNFAVKPYVFAGSVGLLPINHVNKRPKPGMRLFIFGGATGADGLRGAVMSSRDLRSEDFIGSAVQVAQPFVQRRMTDFLLAASALDLIDVITDNGAGGFSSSVGEMATLTGGASIDLTHIRLKYQGLYGWEKLLSESQERMTVATSKPQEFKKLAEEWAQEFDELGELNESGKLTVTNSNQGLVNFDLEFLHEGCPRLQLKTHWNFSLESAELKARKNFSNNITKESFVEKFNKLLDSEHLCSREGIARRFDHEVGGRNLKKLFTGSLQNSPTDGALIEIPECSKPTAISMGHGLAPQYSNIFQNSVNSFDEAIRSLVLAGGKFETAGLLDNYAWPDPTQNPRRLWRLAKSVQSISVFAQELEIPFVSGKDSLKNNSKDYFCPETVVVSVGASTRNLGMLPVSHFSQSNDVVFYLPLISPTLHDSAWHRVGAVNTQELATNPWEEFHVTSQECEQKLKNLARSLKTRYQKLTESIKGGMIKAAKDISEGGLGVTLFEMGLGERFGFFWEKDFEKYSEFDFFSEGLGGFVFCVDPHRVHELESLWGSELQRLGVVMKPFEWKWGRSFFSLNLETAKKSYLKKTQEGFWK